MSGLTIFFGIMAIGQFLWASIPRGQSKFSSYSTFVNGVLCAGIAALFA